MTSYYPTPSMLDTLRQAGLSGSEAPTEGTSVNGSRFAPSDFNPPYQGGSGGGSPASAPSGGIPPLADRLRTVQALLGPQQQAYPASDGTIYILEQGKVVGTVGLDGGYTPASGSSGAAGSGGGSGSGEALAAEGLRAASAERIAAAQQAADLQRTQITESGANDRSAADIAERARENGLSITEQQAQDAQRAKEFGITSGQADQRLGMENAASNSRLSLDASTAQAQQDATAAQLQLTGQNDQANLGITAARMAADQAIADRQAGLAERTQEAKVLSTPSDWLYRAFQSRGGTAPDAKITTADILNSLRGDAANSQAQGNAAVQAAQRAASRFVIPTLAPRIVAPTPYVLPVAGAGAAAAPSAANPYAPFDAIAQQQAAAGTNSTGFNAAGTATPGGQPLDGGTPRMAKGGLLQGGRITGHLPGNAPSRFSLPQPGPGMPNGTPPRLPTNASIPYAADGGVIQDSQGQPNMAVVGDSKNGKPNEELVIDLPNDGGLMVIPKDRLVGTRKVQNSAPDATSRMSGVPHLADGGVVGDASSYLPALQNDYATGNTAAASQLSYQLGHGGWTENDPNNPANANAAGATPNYQPVTQDQLVAHAKAYAPPGVTDALAGNQQQTYRLAEPNLDPHALSQMTPAEQDALNSYLGVVDDTSLSEEQAGMQSRFGTQVNAARSRLSLAGVR